MFVVWVLETTTTRAAPDDSVLVLLLVLVPVACGAIQLAAWSAYQHRTMAVAKDVAKDVARHVTSPMDDGDTV